MPSPALSGHELQQGDLASLIGCAEAFDGPLGGGYAGVDNFYAFFKA